MAILVLQALAVQRGAARGGADQKAPRLAVAGRPGQIADALEAEHGIKDIKRHHRVVAGAVGGRGRKPGAQGADLVDALLQNLSLDVFFVKHDLIGVVGRVALTHRRVDAQLTEHTLHAEGARLIGHDGHHALTDRLVLGKRRQNTHKGHGGGNPPLAAALGLGAEGVDARHRQHLSGAAANRYKAAQFPAPLAHVAHLGAVLVGSVIGNAGQVLVADGNGEAIAKSLQGLDIQLLQGVRFVARLPRLAGAVTFHGHGQHHARALELLRGAGVGRVNLVGIVAAAVEVHDLFVGQVFDQFQRLGVLAEEVLAGVRAAVEFVVLQLAVADLIHALLQHARLVALQQRIPLATPDHLDHIPAGAAEHPLQFLDDLAVTAHRAVEALQVAVDHEDQVAQLLATGQ